MNSPGGRSFPNVATRTEFLGGTAGILYAAPLDDHLPTETELWFSGRISAFKPGHITPVKEVTIGNRVFTVSTSGHNYSEQIVGLFDCGAIKPFVKQASVYGRMQGDVFHASEVLLRPIRDQTANDDPNLPRSKDGKKLGRHHSGSAFGGYLAAWYNSRRPPMTLGGRAQFSPAVPRKVVSQ